MLLQLNDHRRITLGKGDFSDIKRESDRETSRFGSSDNLFFKHPQLSKAHGKLMNDDGRLLLMDVGSSFGTVVNDEFIKPHSFVEIKDFDRIGFIIMRSVSYIKNVVDMSEDILIPLSDFGNPGVMLQFRVVVNKNDKDPHSIDVEFVPIAHLHSRKPNDNSNDEITIFENFESDNEEQQASERFDNDNENDEAEVIDVDEVIDDQEDDSDDSDDSEDAEDAEDAEDSDEKSGNSVASYDLENEDNDTPQSDIEENSTNDPYSYKKYIFGDGEQSDEDDYDYEVNCSDALKDDDALLSEDEGEGSEIEDIITHISPKNYVLNSDEESEDSEDEDYNASHRKKETEGHEEEEEEDDSEEEEDDDSEVEEDDSENEEDVNDAKEPEDKYIGWLSSEIIAHLVHQGLLNYNDVVDSGDSVSGDDYCGDDCCGNDYCGDCNSCDDSEELGWELSDLEDEDLNEDLCYTYNPQQTRKPTTMKSVMKEVGKGMFYVISTVVILGIYGSYQQRNQ